jgi:hypothetical protein
MRRSRQLARIGGLGPDAALSAKKHGLFRIKSGARVLARLKKSLGAL